MASDAVAQIKDRVSIVDVVSPYVELHKAGKHFKGRSPFTAEKTPSFFVSPDRNMYYCFSTSKGGDIFTFVQEMEGVDFKGALKILAEKAGIELVPEDPKKRSERDQLYSALEAATVFYQSELQSASEALQYLSKRGVKKETTAAWRIGYAPGPPQKGWRELTTALEAKKFLPSILLRSGLSKQAEGGKAPYDVFRDRVMFPIADSSGRVVAFSGRLLAKDSEAPKYVNSPETDLFNKSEILFGYDKAKQGIRKFDFSLIVEGQFDVVLAHQAGYTNAVAVSGTALTPNHVALLQRLSHRVVLALDADRAGIAAVARSADIMLMRGMDVKVATLPPGQDPADMIATDPHTFKEVIGKAVHVIEFLLGVLKQQAKDERSFKLAAQEQIVPHLLRIQSHIDREHFEQVIATALSTTKEAIHLEVSRLAESQQMKSIKPRIEERASSVDKVESKTNWRFGELIDHVAVVSEVIAPSLQDRLVEKIKEVVGVDVATLVAEMPIEKKSALLFTLESQYTDLTEVQQTAELNDKLHELELFYLRKAINEKKTALYEVEQEAGDTEVLLNEITVLQKQLAAASTPKNFFSKEDQAD